MAKYNEGFGVSFNDNDGGATWFYSSQGIEEYRRYVSIMGRWRAKLLFMRLMLFSLKMVHSRSVDGSEPVWKMLKGWKP